MAEDNRGLERERRGDKAVHKQNVDGRAVRQPLPYNTPTAPVGSSCFENNMMDTCQDILVAASPCMLATESARLPFNAPLRALGSGVLKVGRVNSLKFEKLQLLGHGCNSGHTSCLVQGCSHVLCSSLELSHTL